MSDAFDSLIELVARLRRDCPWDREQSLESLKTYLLEETYEALDAIDAQAPESLRDELGDLLFQIVFLARLGQERGWFGIEDVARRITSKMIERHPHVFGGAPAADAEEVKNAWERRKRRQPDAQADPLGSLPAALPALAAAYRQTLRAGDLGFDWEKDADVFAKIQEELAEWRAAEQAGDHAAEAREIGDVLLSVVNLARRRKIDPESALRMANQRFRERFADVARRARESGRDVSVVPVEELNEFWEEAKKSRES